MTVNDQQDAKPRLTPEARERLVAELDRLRVQRQDLLATLALDETRGDSADQASAVERGTELDRVDRRVTELTDLLDVASEAAPPTGDTVEIGTLVTVKYGDGDTETVRVGMLSLEDDEVPVLTPASPLGKALLGRRKGESVSYTTPRGDAKAKVVSVKIA